METFPFIVTVHANIYLQYRIPSPESDRLVAVTFASATRTPCVVAVVGANRPSRKSASSPLSLWLVTFDFRKLGRFLNFDLGRFSTLDVPFCCLS